LEEEMKKVILVMAVAVVFAFTGTVLASPPTPPPGEGFLIHTDTDITCVGTVIETESFEWHWNNDAESGNTQGIQPALLVGGETEARIVYEQEFRSQNSLLENTVPTEFDKEFTADSHADDGLNVEVDKIIGFTSNGDAGSVASHEEIIALEVVSAGGGVVGGGFTGVLQLCPWNVTGAGTFNATNEGIAMGSQFAIPNVLADGGAGFISFTSAANAYATEFVQLDYDVNASGRGQIEAEMIARLYEGNGVASRFGPAPGLTSVATYQEAAEADGIFQFHKGMMYQAIFAQPSPNPITLDLFND
jgi:hypothetical protein